MKPNLYRIIISSVKYLLVILHQYSWSECLHSLDYYYTSATSALNTHSLIHGHSFSIILTHLHHQNYHDIKIWRIDTNTQPKKKRESTAKWNPRARTLGPHAFTKITTAGPGAHYAKALSNVRPQTTPLDTYKHPTTLHYRHTWISRNGSRLDGGAGEAHSGPRWMRCPDWSALFCSGESARVEWWIRFRCGGFWVFFLWFCWMYRVFVWLRCGRLSFVFDLGGFLYYIDFWTYNILTVLFFGSSDFILYVQFSFIYFAISSFLSLYLA